MRWDRESGAKAKELLIFKRYRIHDEKGSDYRKCQPDASCCVRLFCICLYCECGEESRIIL